MALLAGDVALLVWLDEGKLVPRFAFAPLNGPALLLLVWAVPILLLGLAATARRFWASLPLLCVGLLLTLPASLESFAAGMAGPIVQLAELDGRAGVLRAYQLDGGATVSRDVVLRREFDVLPGFRLVAVECLIRHAAHATLDPPFR